MSRQTAHFRAVTVPMPPTDDEEQLRLIRELNVALAQVSGTEETAAVVASVAARALGYDDLIVYLRTDDDQLVQRAAYGAKEAGDHSGVEDPLLLPLGVGIVGAAAVTQDGASSSSSPTVTRSPESRTVDGSMPSSND